MKRLFIFVIMIVFLSGCIWAQAVKKYDRFTGKTSIKSNKIDDLVKRDRHKQPVLMLTVEFEGKEIPKDPVIFGTFSSLSDDWKFMNFHDVHILADDMPIKLIRYGRDVDIEKGYLLETIWFQVSWEEFLKIAKAAKLEFKIGIEEFAARPEELKDIKSFKDLILK